MGTQIFLQICMLAIGFMVYCLIHFVKELRMLKSHDGSSVVRPAIRESGVLQFPGGRRVMDQNVEVRRRA